MITAGIPMFTMRSFKEKDITYTVLAMETNMKEKGKCITHYQVDVHLPLAVKTLRGYSTQHHMDAFALAKRRGRNWIKNTLS